MDKLSTFEYSMLCYLFTLYHTMLSFMQRFVRNLKIFRWTIFFLSFANFEYYIFHFFIEPKKNQSRILKFTGWQAHSRALFYHKRTNFA
jgi:hypothetical protein